jgi:CBS domain-containing protein
MKVKEVLKVKGSSLFTATPDTLLSDAVVTMADQDMGSLVVMERGKLVGMLTFREVLVVLAKRQKEGRVGPTPTFSQIKVGDALHDKPITTDLNMEVDELRRIMLETHTRYVPVMDGETLLGVISFHDVARAVLEERSLENKLLKAYIRDWPEEEEKK